MDEACGMAWPARRDVDVGAGERRPRKSAPDSPSPCVREEGERISALAERTIPERGSSLGAYGAGDSGDGDAGAGAGDAGSRFVRPDVVWNRHRSAADSARGTCDAPGRASRSGEVVGAPPSGFVAGFVSAMATSPAGAAPLPAANARAAAAASAPASTRSEASASKNALSPSARECVTEVVFLLTKRTSSSSRSTSVASSLSRTSRNAPGVAGTDVRARPPTPFPATPDAVVSLAASRAARALAFSTPCHLAHSPGSTTASLTASDSGVSAACSSFPPPALDPATTQNLCTRRCPARLRSDRTIVSLCASTHAQRSQCSPGLCVYTTRTSVASGSSLFDTSTPRFSGCVCADAMATKLPRAFATASHASHSKSHRTPISASRARLALTPRLVARSARRQTRAGRRALDPSPAAPRRPSPGGSLAPRVRRSGRRRRATKKRWLLSWLLSSAVSQGSVASRGKHLLSEARKSLLASTVDIGDEKARSVFPRNRPTRSRGV